MTLAFSGSKPCASVYPISRMTFRATSAVSTLTADMDVTARKTSPVATAHSADTWASGSR